MFDTSKLLRQALLLDAAASGTMGVAMTAASGPVAGLLDLPMPFVLYIGIFLIAFALFLFALARQERPAPALIWLVIVGNVGRVVASIAILFTDLIAPNTVGTIVIVAQAAAVALFAELQLMGQRRLSAVAA